MRVLTGLICLLIDKVLYMNISAVGKGMGLLSDKGDLK